MRKSIAPPKKFVQFFVAVGVPPAMHKIAAIMPAIWIVTLQGTGTSILASRGARANVRSGSRLCENPNVQLACRISVSISSMRNRITLATSVERRRLRKQFCASLARSRFHTAWVIFRPQAFSKPGPFVLQQRTCRDCIGMSVSCQQATSARNERGRQLRRPYFSFRGFFKNST